MLPIFSNKTTKEVIFILNVNHMSINFNKSFETLVQSI